MFVILIKRTELQWHQPAWVSLTPLLQMPCQGSVLLTIWRSYVGNYVTHSTLLDRACACSYKNFLNIVPTALLTRPPASTYALSGLCTLWQERLTWWPYTLTIWSAAGSVVTPSLSSPPTTFRWAHYTVYTSIHIQGITYSIIHAIRFCKMKNKLTLIHTSGRRKIEEKTLL